MRDTLSFYSALFYRDFFAYAAEELEKLGLHYGALPFIIYIGKHRDCTPAELTKALKADWGHSQRSITKLVQGDFVIKERSKSNARTYRLDLTEKGRKAFRVSHQVFFSWDENAFSELTEGERAELFRLLQKIHLKNEEKRNV